MDNCSNNFFLVLRNICDSRRSLTHFFMLAEKCIISSCCVVTYTNITCCNSTITGYKNVQEITVGYVKKLQLN